MMKDVKKPPVLRPGDRVGLIAPAGAVREPEYTPQALAARVAALGYEPVVGSVGALHGYLAGEDALRLEDLHGMFADDTVRAIWCVRGGYGVMRLLDHIDFGLLRAHPKLLIGYSDITALHLAMHSCCDYPTLHAPMVCSGALADAFSLAALRRALEVPGPLGLLPSPPDLAIRCLCPGVAEGVLIGGNLSLLAGLCGTPWMPDVRGKILLIEEIGESTYAVDRLLTHLRLCGLFDACAGVVLGGFTDCEIEHPGFGLTLEQVIEEVVLPCGKPVLAGVAAGHCVPTLSLPMGVRYRLDADAGKLSVLEALYR